jgi:hypothetical protein
MVKPFPSKTHIGNHMLHPETLMLNYGYDPQLSEGAVKPPVFLTSTFVFKTAEDGQDFFDYVLAGASPPRGNGRRLGLFALQPSQQRRSSKTGFPSTNVPTDHRAVCQVTGLFDFEGHACRSWAAASLRIYYLLGNGSKGITVPSACELY